MAAKKFKYYSLKRLIDLHPECLYYFVYGERSNGKSYSALEYTLEEFYNSGFTKSYGYLRRYTEDVRMSNMNQVYKSLKKNDLGVNRIAEITNGEYNDVIYRNRCFYLAHRTEAGEYDLIVESQPLGYVFNLSESERIKSTGYPDIFYIIFEEFISESLPLVQEFKRFMSVLSTIIRNDDKVKIFLLGNTVNKHNIYFKEFGLTRTKFQQPNTIDIYKYTDEDGKILNIACEFADFPDRKLKKSNIYFCFNKEKNKMIRNGAWDIEVYPHLEYFYAPKNIKLIYFIKYESEIFQCEVIRVLDTKDNRIINNENDIYSNKPVLFTYIHRKTTEIKKPYDHIIFQEAYDSHPNIRHQLNNCYDDIGRFIWSFFISDKVFYQDNVVGDMVDSYMKTIGMR